MGPQYVLVTAARNEEAYIEKTIRSVISQTVLPKKWVIVSDGSTDRTDEIAKRYAAKHEFIEFMRLEEGDDRNFASQAATLKAGVEQLNGTTYDYLGLLDADLSFDPSYYESVLEKLRDNPRLGIAGGVVFDKVKNAFNRQLASSDSVAGAIQMFRRKCYEDVGGYFPLQKGGKDGVAEVMARMHGWEVRSFSDIEVLHYRPNGTANTSMLVARFHQGSGHYIIGYHPFFEFMKCMFRCINKPFFLGSFFMLSGYCWSWIRRHKRALPIEVVTYLRKEQMQRLFSMIRKPKSY